MQRTLIDFILLPKDTVGVAFNVELIQILGVDEKSQTVKLITWNTFVSWI